MRDQPHAWQYRSNDAAEPATGMVPAPREDTDDAEAGATHDGNGSTAWAPSREGEEPSQAGSPRTDGSSAPDLDAPAPSPDVDAEIRGDGEPAVGVAQVPDDAAARGGAAADGAAADGAAADGATAQGATAHGYPGQTVTSDEPDGDSAAVDEAGDEPAVDRSTVDETAFDRPAAGTTGYDGADSGDTADRVAPDDSVAAGETGAADETALDDETTLDDKAAVDDEDDAGDEAASGAGVAAPVDQAPDGELMPGDVPEQPMVSLFEGTAADGFRDRWQQVQMRFVDNPRSAADEARTVTDDVVSALHDALNERIRSLGEWQTGRAGDTEELRIAVRRYRDLLDRLLGL